jgi:Phage tail sheath C-terminal domain
MADMAAAASFPRHSCTAGNTNQNGVLLPNKHASLYMTINKTILLCCFLISSSWLLAQPPGIDDSIMSIKRKWTRGEPDVHAYDPAIQPKHFPIIYETLEAVAALVRQAYPTPTGTEAMWYTSVRGYPYYQGGPSPYSVNCIFQYYYYNTAYKKITRVGETGTWAYIHINDFGVLLDDAGLEIENNGVKIKSWKLSPEKGTWKGYTIYDAFGFGPRQNMVLLTRNGQLPWQPVSRLQFLEALRHKIEDEKIRTRKTHDEGIAKTQKMIEEIIIAKGYSNDVKTRMKTAAEVQLEKQVRSRDEQIKKTNEFFNLDLAFIDNYISTHSKEELSQQAIVNMSYQSFLTKKKFADPHEKASYRLVYIDQSYFDKTQPFTNPQFLAIRWRWNDNAPGLFFKNQFEENFPVERLQELLIVTSPPTGKIRISLQDIKTAVETIVRSVSGNNDSVTWANVKKKIDDYLLAIWKEGALKGASASEAFFVKADHTTMTQNDIQNGRLVVEIGIALVKPADFVIFRADKQL